MVDRLHILIVEDDEILGLNLSAAIEDRYCSGLGPVATVADAMAKLEACEIDGAILDTSLLDRDVTPVAMELIDRGIPFVIHTGVGLPAELGTVFPQVSVITKPTDPDEVIVQLLSQIRALGAKAGSTQRAVDPTGGSQDRTRQIERVASSLFDHFGGRAVVLARRQAARAEANVLVSWLDIIDAIGKMERVPSS